MAALAVVAYQRWQQIVFWMSWIALLVPGYFLAFGTLRMVNLVWMGYQDQMDWLLMVILVLGLVALVLIAVLTYWAYQTASRGYWNLMMWQVAGLLGVPFITMLGCILVYFQLAMNGVLPTI